MDEYLKEDLKMLGLAVLIGFVISIPLVYFFPQFAFAIGVLCGASGLCVSMLIYILRN